MRVQPSGARSYIAQIGRSRRITVAEVGVITPEDARERCQLILGNIAHGRTALHGIDGTAELTLGGFIESTYDPWLRANRPRSAAPRLQRLGTIFSQSKAVPLEQLNVEMIERWKLARIKARRRPATITRDWRRSRVSSVAP